MPQSNDNIFLSIFLYFQTHAQAVQWKKITCTRRQHKI